MQLHIRGHEHNIDIGNHPPASCKPPRCGLHESRVINKLVKALEDKGLIEDNFGPHGGSDGSASVET